MNQGKIWLVVSPTVGLPAFLGGVALISLAVHAAVLSNTTWYPAIYSGKAATKTASVEQAAPAVAKQTPSADAVAPGAAAVSSASTSVVLAAASPGKTQ